MKIPKYIEKALHSRTIAAESWNSADYVISKYIIKNNLENDIASEDYAGGVESIVNPYESELRIIKAIEQKGGHNDNSRN